MSRPWCKSVDVIIQFDQLLCKAFIRSDGPLAPKKKNRNVKNEKRMISWSTSSYRVSHIEMSENKLL